MKKLLTLAAIVGTAFLAGSANAATYLPGSYTITANTTGIYSISVSGGQGGEAFGDSSRVRGGYGTMAVGNFMLTAGEQLGVFVGAVGAFNGTYGRGGGGSFVYLISNGTLLLAGGGGGGATSVDPLNGYRFSSGGDASTISSALTVSGGSVAGVDGQNGGCCGTSAYRGLGGLSSINSATPSYMGGGSSALATAGGAGSVSITSPVPEPATWAMMLIGFGMVGVTVRLRRRSTKVTYA